MAPVQQLVGSASKHGLKRPNSELNGGGSQVQGSAPSTQNKVQTVVSGLKRSCSESDLPSINPSAPKEMKRVVGLFDMSNEMILEVFKHLPLNSLIRFSGVSRHARRYANEIFKDSTYLTHGIPQIEPKFLMSSLSFLFKQAKGWSKGELLDVARRFSNPLKWEAPEVEFLPLGQKKFWDPELVKEELSIFDASRSPLLTIDSPKKGLWIVTFKINVMLIKHFFGDSQKIASDIVSKKELKEEQLEFLLSQLPNVDRDLCGFFKYGLSLEFGYVLSNMSLYFNFATPKTLVLLLDFMQRNGLRPTYRLPPELSEIESRNRRKECFEVLFEHPSFVNLQSFFVKEDGSNSKVMKVGGSFYSEEGLLRDTGSLKDDFGNDFTGEFRFGEPYNGVGVLTHFQSFEHFKGVLKNGKPEGLVEITHESGNQFIGVYKDGFPQEGIGEVKDELNRTFYFGEFQESTYTPLRKIAFQFGDTWIAPSSEEVESQDQKKLGEMGTYHFAEGAVYTGSLRDFRPNGEGKKSYPNGDFEEGVFKDSDFLNGHASINYYNNEIFSWYTVIGGIYKGEFQYDKRHGQGSITMADGYSLDGTWIDGKRHGTFTGTSPDGQTNTIIYDNDQRFDGVFRIYNPDGTFELVKFISGQQVPLNNDVAS